MANQQCNNECRIHCDDLHCHKACPACCPHGQHGGPGVAAQLRLDLQAATNLFNNERTEHHETHGQLTIAMAQVTTAQAALAASQAMAARGYDDNASHLEREIFHLDNRIQELEDQLECLINVQDLTNNQMNN
jgi:hypothetical protein